MNSKFEVGGKKGPRIWNFVSIGFNTWILPYVYRSVDGVAEPMLAHVFILFLYKNLGKTRILANFWPKYIDFSNNNP